jgi:toxin ParE1/3/4
MFYKIVFVQKANIQLNKAINWCSEQNPKLELKFLKSFDKAIKDIQNNPFKYQIKYELVRIVYLKNPKFGIHYFINLNEIFVVGIFHTSQDSEDW